MGAANSITPIWADPGVLTGGQYVGILIGIALALILPLVLMIVYFKKVGFRPVLVGALCFVVVQVLFRIPLLQMFQAANLAWIQSLSPLNMDYHLYLFAVSVTAGLVEEWGRYIFMRTMLKGQRSVQDAVGFGVGHGGIEAILIVGVSLLSQLLLMPQVYSNTAPWALTLGGVERVFAICFHVAMSVLVMRRGLVQVRYVWLAVLLHTLFNYIPLALPQLLGIDPGLLPLVTEVVVMLMAAVGLWYVVAQVRRDRIQRA